MNIFNIPHIAPAATAPILDDTEQPFEVPAGRLEFALERHRAEFAAVPKHALIEITINVRDAMLDIGAYSRRWTPYWKRIATLPEVDFERLRAIPSLVDATLCAHVDYLTTREPRSNLYQTLTEAIGVRDALLFDARVMVRRGLLPVASLDGIVRQQGYQQVATELGILVRLLKEHWQHVESKVSTTDLELQQAAMLVHTLSNANRPCPSRSRHTADAVLLRKQAFTVTVRAYYEMRRCLRFLTRRRQIDDLAPSLYKGRGGRKRKVTGSPVLNSIQDNPFDWVSLGSTDNRRGEDDLPLSEPRGNDRIAGGGDAEIELSREI